MAMKAVLLLALVGAAAAARIPINTVNVNRAETDEMAVSAATISAVNSDKSHRSSWTAGESEFFKGMTAKEARNLLGLRETTADDAVLETKSYAHIADADIPATFDARDAWPGLISPIRNQAQCGSCWAFAAAETLTDRFHIATNGSMTDILSPEDLVACDTTDMGCQGGQLTNVWAWIREHGITSDSCIPYSSGAGVVPACPATCADGSPIKRVKSTDAFQVQTVADIQKAIMTDGPVEAGFTVYKSFMAYTGGVYEHHWWQVWDTIEGGHAIKIIGWGNDSTSGEDYWLVANSWTTSWGEDGYFRIKKGVNECGIEGQVFAGHPQV